MNLPSLQAIELLKHPSELLQQIQNNFDDNGYEIIRDLQDAQAQYHMGNWYNMGDDVGQILAKLVVSPESTVVDINPPDAQTVKQFVMGLATGFFPTAVLSDGPDCIDNVQGLVQDVEEVYKRSLRLVLCNRQA